MDRRTIAPVLGLVLVVAVMLGGLSVSAVQAGSASASQAKWPTCTTAGLGAAVVGPVTVDGKGYFSRWMATVLDEAMDDSGVSASGDNLEMYCVTASKDDQLGNIAMCLSGEACPWRAGS